MINCSRCDTQVPKARSDMGYTICVNCSVEKKKVGHVIYPHKTGAYIQVVDGDTKENLNRLDRRGTGGIKTAKHYKAFSVDKKEQSKPFSERKCTKVYTSYNEAIKKVLEYYDEWGYEPTLQYLRKLNVSGEIPLMTRVKIQDKITEMYLKPTPRALVRKFNKSRETYG